MAVVLGVGRSLVWTGVVAFVVFVLFAAYQASTISNSPPVFRTWQSTISNFVYGAWNASPATSAPFFFNSRSIIGGVQVAMFAVLVLCGTIKQSINPLQSCCCCDSYYDSYRFFLDDAAAAVKVSCFLFLDEFCCLELEVVSRTGIFFRFLCVVFGLRLMRCGGGGGDGLFHHRFR